MINSTNRNDNFITPEKAASFLPIIISSFFAFLIIIFFVIPESIKSNKVNLELKDLIKKKNNLNDLKLKYKINNEKFDLLSQEKAEIINLIGGSSNLDTMIANLGDIGKKNNIEYIKIVPKNITRFIENKLPDNNDIDEVQSLIDPLLVEGIKKYLLEITFETDFVNLLSFLRELEFQENLILINNINVKFIGDEKNLAKIRSTKKTLYLELNMNFYGKI